MNSYDLWQLEEQVKQAGQQLRSAAEAVTDLRKKLVGNPAWLALLGAAETELTQAEVKLTSIRQQVAATVGDDEQPAVEVEDGRA